MAHPAPVSGLTGDTFPEESAPRISLRALPSAVTVARDDLFRDADRHGPRWPVLVRRSVPALLVLPALVLLAAWAPWRTLVLGESSARIADLLLVAPILAALVLVTSALAPLARIRVEPLLGAGMVLLAVATWLTSNGSIVVATIPAAFGAAFVGIAAARAVRRAVWTLPLLIAAGVSDTSSVEGGVTRTLLGEAGQVGPGSTTSIEPVLSIAPEAVTRLDLLVLHLPAASGTWMLGLVDVVALGMLLGLAHLYWLPVGRTAIALGVALALTLGFGVPVPVLPMLGIAWLLVHARLVWRSTRFSLRRLTYLGG